MAKKSGGAAVADAPVASNWQEVSAAVATAVADKTHDRTVADLKRWRELVVAIADGAMAVDGAVDELSDIAVRLRLPPSAIRDDVAAIQNRRNNEKLLVSEQAKSDQAQADAAEAVKQIPELEARLVKLRNAVALAPVFSQRVAGVRRDLDTVSIANPRVFGDLDTLAKEMSPHGN